jgi:hypothetical protein
VTTADAYAKLMEMIKHHPQQTQRDIKAEYNDLCGGTHAGGSGMLAKNAYDFDGNEFDAMKLADADSMSGVAPTASLGNQPARAPLISKSRPPAPPPRRRGARCPPPGLQLQQFSPSLTFNASAPVPRRPSAQRRTSGASTRSRAPMPSRHASSTSSASRHLRLIPSA